MNIAILGSITFSVYLIGALAVSIKLNAHYRRLKWLYAATAPCAWLMHGSLLLVMYLENVLDFGFFNAASIYAWLTISIVLLLQLRYPLHSLGVVLFPTAGICALLSALYSMQAHNPAHGNMVLQLHILSSVFAYSLLLIAAIQAIILAIQDYRLHNHHTEGITQMLPPLKVIERLMFRIITIGFVLLTISGISGFMVVERWLTHKNIFSIIAWGIFATLLFGRQQFGWRGRKAVRLTLSGTIFLILAYFGSRLVLELILNQNIN